MDTYAEQLVVIKSSPKTISVKIAIWVVACLVAAGLIFMSVLHLNIAFLLMIVAAAVIFAAYYMSSQLNAEYEYIVTNGDIDIDRIINKRKRQRMASFTGSDIENIEKYDVRRHFADKKSSKRIYFGCTPSEDSLAFTVRHPKSGVYVLVITPNDTVKEAIKKALPYTLKNKL